MNFKNQFNLHDKYMQVLARINTHITQILSACSTAQIPVFTCICDTKYFWNIKTFVVVTVQESYQ